VAPIKMPIEDRLVRLLDHLGIRRAHFAASFPYAAQLLAARPTAVASAILVRPGGFDPVPWQGHGERLLMVYGDAMPSVPEIRQSLRAIPNAREAVLRGYAHFPWSDVAVDRTEELHAHMRAFLDRMTVNDHTPSIRPLESQGEVAGLTYRVESGPPLVLLPVGLAPTQWNAVIPPLAEAFCVISVGGRYLGAVATLEERGSTWGYHKLLASVLEEMALDVDANVLEVGCGSGVVCRWLAERVSAPITGVDLSPYMLGEAKTLAAHEGLLDRISFRQGSAEDLPFADASFGAVLSVTVMEEVDADRMLAEMLRVTQPGGRIGIVVRATDVPHWLSLGLPVELAQRISRSIGAFRAERGCADKSLYRRVRAAGLTDVRCWPYLTAFYPEVDVDENWVGAVSGIVASLSPIEAEQWHEAVARARAEGGLVWAQTFHCAVGTKPL